MTGIPATQPSVSSGSRPPVTRTTDGAGRSLFADLATTIERLAEVGLATEDVPRDGNCAFHCYARNIGLNESINDTTDAAMIRQAVCDQIAHDEEFFVPLLPEQYAGSMLNYLNYMRQQTHFG